MARKPKHPIETGAKRLGEFYALEAFFARNSRHDGSITLTRKELGELIARAIKSAFRATGQMPQEPGNG